MIPAVNTHPALIHVHNSSPVAVDIRESEGTVFVSLRDERTAAGPTIVFDDLNTAGSIVEAMMIALHDLSLSNEVDEDGTKRTSCTVFKPVTLGEASTWE